MSDEHLLKFRRYQEELIQLSGADSPEPSLADREWIGYGRRRLQAVFRVRLADPDWFEPLMWAAVYDPDPSFCQAFVEPALAACGRRRVQEFLIRMLREGTDPEIAGAAQAWYWSHLPTDSIRRWSAPPVTQIDDDGARQRWVEWSELALHIFVHNEHLGVRCCLLSKLSLNVEHYRPELHPLVNQAIHIARTSTDDYLRHRVEAQI